MATRNSIPLTLAHFNSKGDADSHKISNAGIYLSIPYCRQKCTYCNFASAARPIAELPRYLQALEWEILHCAEIWEGAGLPPRIPASADSLYMGGGTPGLLKTDQLTGIMNALRTTFATSPMAEITLEASPENVTPERAAAWAACGINRVSLGVQSMVEKELRAVGRMHTAAGVAESVATLRRAGIDNFSVDLITGLPHQTAETWEATLQAILELTPPHLSVYMLEVDQDSSLGGEILQGGTRYAASAVPSDEVVVELYTRALERFADADFLHYEISNFARPGCASRHNEKYWTQVPYFGFGVDAHSYDGDFRWANIDSITSYLDRMDRDLSPIQESTKLEPAQKLEERFFLGLRRRQGILLTSVLAACGDAVADKYRERIETYCDTGWLEVRGDRLRLTDQGVLFSNEVFAAFLAERTG
ncbi:MAG: radical SAM family heme chaperone HemW [Acidobacteria bacterium]|nr:radical SAM family heme chaperone HemW [Acidobacteriota bacterium]